MAMASATLERSLVRSATSAVSIAAADPATPMAMPTSAAPRAGASLMPSPTMARVPLPMKRRRRDLGPPAAASSLATRPTTSSIFLAGVIPAMTFPRGISHACATRSALPWLSPVSMTTSAPLLRSDATAPGAVARRASSHRSAPAQSPSTPTHRAVAPARSHSAAAAASAGSSRPQPRRLARAGPPISTSLPSTLALAPSPGRVLNSVTLHCLAAMRTAAPLPASTAAATGCEARSSSAHAQRSSAPAPSAGLGF
mmetsp:Transcript_13140/g.59320  ORF Transcript_13140/g.59320 Transcript_13140/m.59320 type:complete len:256 (-) Transcript_13140:2154-2921(-)